MRNFYQKIFCDQSKLILGVVLIILLIGSIYLFWFNGFLTEQTAVQATQRRTTMLSRAGAASIETMISLVRTQLLLVANDEEVASFNIPSIRNITTHAIQVGDEPIVRQFGLTDANGTLIVMVTRSGTREGEGTSLADRSYFQWAKTAKIGEVFLSEPIISRAGENRGQWVLILATPVLKQGKFLGVLYLSLRLEDIQTLYVNKLGIDPSHMILLLNKEGIMVSSSFFGDLIGQNIRQYAQEKKWAGYESFVSMIDTMMRNGEGQMTYWFMGTDGGIRKWVGSYTPVKSKGQTMLYFTISTPYALSQSYMDSLFFNQRVLFIFLAIISVVITFIWILVYYSTKQSGFLDGLERAAQFHKKKTFS